MDIKEPHSFAVLLVQSFMLMNRIFSVLLVFVLIAVLGFVALSALSWAHVPSLAIAGLMGLYTALLGVMLIKLFTSRAEKDNLSLPDIAAASAFPTLYMIIVLLVVAVVGLLLGLISSIMGGLQSKFALLLVGLVGLFCIARFLFVPVAVAVREQNPMQAFMYSWQLTRKHLIYVLATLVTALIVGGILIGGVGYGLYVAIPLYFADSFNLAQLSGMWIGVLVAFVLFVIGVCFSMISYIVLVFLNLDYQENRGSVPSVALPQTQVTNEASAGDAAQADSQDMQILRASVKSQNEDDTLSQHLEQVYQPKPQDIVQYAEEDRMPTILFDDAMAKQMEDDRMKWEQEKAKSRQKNNPSDEEDNSTPIKMSR